MSEPLIECTSHAPAAFGAYYHWRNWHRGTGCSKDDGRPRTAESAQLIAKLGEDHPRVMAPPQLIPDFPPLTVAADNLAEAVAEFRAAEAADAIDDESGADAIATGQAVYRARLKLDAALAAYRDVRGAT